VDDILKRLGKRIREIRILRGFTSQEAFADYCKMHRTFLGHLETGRKDFRLTTIIRVADALGVTLSDLFAGVEHGEAFMPRRKHAGEIDLQRVRHELDLLEQGVRNLRELASPDNQVQAGVRKARRRARLHEP